MDYDADGREVLKCGFKIGGGIDQNYKKSPQGYTDNVISRLKLTNEKKKKQTTTFLHLGHLRDRCA